ncbi:hypothetical protein BLNAU_18141 [Blattamonas nauphoetae]|uniref:Uncharacterized protein n=1 Tax=Blattamonas nauphoetae TaxID=2049346 RepID=A0ABQ9X7F7_9EUKA|nr:hypothetical protein BLNAU_18141 [Blattamonas nauphoetae]
MTTLDSKTTSCTGSPCPDRSPFLNWSGGRIDSVNKRAVVFQSLVATMKFQPALDGSLETKAVKFLKCILCGNRESTDAFINYFARNTDGTMTDFVQSIVVLVSTTSQAIKTTAMEIMKTLILRCSASIHLAIVEADLIPRLIVTLNPQSLSFAETVDIHVPLLKIVSTSLYLATPAGLAHLAIKDDNQHQAVHETVLQQIVVPSEKYIRHFCVNRYSIINGALSGGFMGLLARLLAISPYHQPTMDFVLSMPVVLTIPSCLTFFEDDHSIFRFLDPMIVAQQEWNKTVGEVRQMWKTVHRMLRMEGIEDVMETKLLNNKNRSDGRLIVADSITWNNILGMNLPNRW